MTETKFSNTKFHPVCFELSVALQLTLAEDAEINPVSGEHSYPDLIHRNPHETVVRIHFPANISGNLKEGHIVHFLPWINLVDDFAGQYELIFRIRPINRQSDTRRKLAFARSGEEKTFSLKGNSGVGYMPLDFLTEHVKEFKTLYIVTQSNPYDNNSPLKYYKFDAKFAEGKIIATVVEVEKNSTPTHMQSFR